MWGRTNAYAGIIGFAFSVFFQTSFFIKVFPIGGVIGAHSIIKKFYDDYEVFIRECLEADIAPGQILAALPDNLGFFNRRPDWLLDQRERPRSPSHTQRAAQITLEPEQYIIDQKAIESARLLAAVEEYRVETGCSFPEALKAIKERSMEENPQSSNEALPVPSVDKVREYLQSGKTILAIKEYRAVANCGLNQARAEIKEKYGYDV